MDKIIKKISKYFKHARLMSFGYDEPLYLLRVSNEDAVELRVCYKIDAKDVDKVLAELKNSGIINK